MKMFFYNLRLVECKFQKINIVSLALIVNISRNILKVDIEYTDVHIFTHFAKLPI